MKYLMQHIHIRSGLVLMNRQVYFIKAIFLPIILLACTNSKELWNVSRKRVECHIGQNNTCSYKIMRGIALGDEPGYYIDTAYIDRGIYIFLSSPAFTTLIQ